MIPCKLLKVYFIFFSFGFLGVFLPRGWRCEWNRDFLPFWPDRGSVTFVLSTTIVRKLSLYFFRLFYLYCNLKPDARNAARWCASRTSVHGGVRRDMIPTWPCCVVELLHPLAWQPNLKQRCFFDRTNPSTPISSYYGPQRENLSFVITSLELRQAAYLTAGAPISSQ